MLLLKIAYSDEEKFIEDIQVVKELFKEKGINIGISEQIENNTHFIKIFCDESLETIEEVKKSLILNISNIIYKVIVQKYRDRELLEYLTENYFFLRHNEVIEIDRKLKKVLSGNFKINTERQLQCIKSITQIEKAVVDFIKEDDFINIDGFIRFRLKSIRPYIEEIIDKIVEEYMVEKEYNEFISLLKYFVEIQESKIEKVNIFITKDKKYIVEDSGGNDLIKLFMSELNEEKNVNDINIEDIIISGLITNAPKEIEIYNRKFSPNEEFMTTISKVFQERVKFSVNKNIL